ncbi:MAG: hypothetical protein QXN96_00340 [Candidatus Bathyarchaeia archaeon]
MTFHTLRHWKATMEYYRTRDFPHIVELLGHKNPKNTLKYVHLAELLGLNNDEYVCRIAKKPEEIVQLVEAGFEYVCQQDGVLFFRKRK